LVETDGPYIKFGNRPVRPDDVPGVVRSLAERWNHTPAEVAEMIEATWDRLLSRGLGGSA
ncbi:MAG: TatD family hydrolase, partial [Actinomycetota bacterium]